MSISENFEEIVNKCIKKRKNNDENVENEASNNAIHFKITT